MVFLKAVIVAIAVTLCVAAAPFALAPAWADGGGAGIQFQIQYDENADEDEDDEDEPGGLTLKPLGFGAGLTLKYNYARWADTESTYTAEPEEPAKQETWSGITLDGPSLSEDKITYFTPRFNARLPAISYTPAEPGTAVDVGEPITPSATFEIKPRFEHWTWLWVGETAVEKVAEDPSPRVGYSLSYGVKDDLRLSASYTMWKDDAEKPQTGAQQASAGTASLSESIKSNSRAQTVQAVQTGFGVPEERAEEFVDGMQRFIQNERARNYLGNDTYRKLQQQFGSATDGAGTQPFASGSAADHSDWSGLHLYCGGSCVYGF